MATASNSKFGDKGESLAEYRIRRRNGRKNTELSTKRRLRIRDGIGCRWPGCDYWKHGVIVEGAHLVDKGMGGDPKQIRTQVNLMMRLCKVHHQGPQSLHSGHREITFLTVKKADGPCSFLSRKTLQDRWVTDGVENDFDVRSRCNPAAADDTEDDE